MFLEGYFDPNICQLGPVGMVKEGLKKKKKKKNSVSFCDSSWVLAQNKKF